MLILTSNNLLVSAKEIPSYLGYFADKYGNIYSSLGSFSKVANGGYKRLKPIQVAVGKRGYKKINRNVVNLKKNGIYRTVYMAQLILETFVSLRPLGKYACHGVRGSLDDSLDNLYWATPKQNAIDRIRDGTSNCGKIYNTKSRRIV
jgi:hypothetical protein